MKITKILGVAVTTLAFALTACTNVSEPDPINPDNNDSIEAPGDGTNVLPFTVSDLLTMNPQSTTEAVKTGVWVKGYVVGFYNSNVNPSVIENQAPFTDDVNIMLATDSTETNKAKMISIQLPAGNVRTALGLKTNPSNIGLKILVYGDIMKYNTFAGVKNTSAYWFVKSNTGIEPPAPGEFNVPEMSIIDLRSQWNGAMKTITDKKKIVGVVATDISGGNTSSLKNLTIVAEDNSAGIMVRLTEDNKYNLGDVVEITLENIELNQYGMAIQLNNVPTVKTRKIESGRVINPVITTIANVRTNYSTFESRVVTLTGTLTSGGGGTWYSGSAAGQNNKITSETDELTVYVTKYATFKSEAIPSGEKTVTGVVGQYSTASSKVYQLIIRNTNDVK